MSPKSRNLVPEIDICPTCRTKLRRMVQHVFFFVVVEERDLAFVQFRRTRWELSLYLL